MKNSIQMVIVTFAIVISIIALILCKCVDWSTIKCKNESFVCPDKAASYLRSHYPMFKDILSTNGVLKEYSTHAREIFDAGAYNNMNTWIEHVKTILG